MPTFPISRRIAILSLLIGLLAWLAAFPAAAATLVPDKTTIAVGETTYVKLNPAPPSR